MAIHNKSHHNHALIRLNQMRRDGDLHSGGAELLHHAPNESLICLNIMDCCEFLKRLPDESVQLICIDPPYNLELAEWGVYADYLEWAAAWLQESWRVLSRTGNLVIFGGIQFRENKSGDLLDLIYYLRNKTQFKLINTIIWHYKNGMSAQRYFANRHEEAVWLAKSDAYYFDLDAVRVPYSAEQLQAALKDKRLNPDNVRKGQNRGNVWEIGRLNGNSRERVGHPTQKPLQIVANFVKSLSYPGSVVLDFFAGSGTTGRGCIEEGRHCLLCDADAASLEFFDRHVKNMQDKAECKHLKFKRLTDTESFFAELNAKKAVA